MIKNILMGGVALLAIAGAANAADLPVKGQQVAPIVAPYIGGWTGWYMGLQIGYGWDWSGTDINAAGTTLATLGNAPHGITGGGRMGYDIQLGGAVLGIVTDINIADFNSNTTMAAGGINIANTTNWWGTTNARLGLSTLGDHFLPYVTAGAAYGGDRSSLALVGGTASAANTSVGWNAGAGIETRVTRNVSLFIEGKYIDLGTVTVPLGTVLGPTTTSNQRFTFGVVEGGINYRF